mmetsp:Transcript_42271/g.120524  ORF Transcript_42271/g.120524 Transcript_42271/m.120524 type:complete len:205 (+) Transcript_42271:306-920(+)
MPTCMLSRIPTDVPGTLSSPTLAGGSPSKLALVKLQDNSVRLHPSLHSHGFCQHAVCFPSQWMGGSCRNVQEAGESLESPGSSTWALAFTNRTSVLLPTFFRNSWLRLPSGALFMRITLQWPSISLPNSDSSRCAADPTTAQVSQSLLTHSPTAPPVSLSSVCLPRWQKVWVSSLQGASPEGTSTTQTSELILRRAPWPASGGG